MKKNLTSVGVLALFVILASLASGAACTVGNELSPGAPNGNFANSCTVTANGLLYSNFAYSIASETTGFAGALSITFNGTSFAANDLSLFFTPNLGNNSGGLAAGIYDVHFAYQITGPNLGGSITVVGSDASVGEQNCTTGAAGVLTGVCSGTTLWSVNAGANTSDTCGPGSATTGTGNSTCNWGASQNTVWVFKDILLGTTQSGGLTLLNADDHFTSLIEDNLVPASGVPEPMTLSLMGAGLLGLGLLRRRMAK
jgi:hypothetical protein